MHSTESIEYGLQDCRMIPRFRDGVPFRAEIAPANAPAVRTSADGHIFGIVRRLVRREQIDVEPILRIFRGADEAFIPGLDHTDKGGIVRPQRNRHAPDLNGYFVSAARASESHHFCLSV